MCSIYRGLPCSCGKRLPCGLLERGWLNIAQMSSCVIFPQMQFSITGCLKEEKKRERDSSSRSESRSLYSSSTILETHKCYLTLCASHFSLSVVRHCLHRTWLLDSVASGVGLQQLKVTHSYVLLAFLWFPLSRFSESCSPAGAGEQADIRATNTQTSLSLSNNVYFFPPFIMQQNTPILTLVHNMCLKQMGLLHNN